MKRLRALQTASHLDLKLLGAIDGDFERPLHIRFARNRVRGEWFFITSDIAAALQSEFGLKLPAALRPTPQRSIGPRREMVYFSDEELQRFFSAISNRRDRALFRIMYHRGLRAHEVGLLTLSDYDAFNRTLHVKRGKHSLEGTHRLCDEELRDLKYYLRVRGVNPGPLFPSNRGTGIGRAQLFVLMRKYCAAAGIPIEKAHPHVLKHSCGVHLTQQGKDLFEIRARLGHRNISNTARYHDLLHGDEPTIRCEVAPRSAGAVRS